jgi:hypothetical protein
VHRAPVSLPNRDVIIHAVIEPMTAKKPYVLFKLNAVPDYMPAQTAASADEGRGYGH